MVINPQVPLILRFLFCFFSYAFPCFPFLHASPLLLHLFSSLQIYHPSSSIINNLIATSISRFQHHLPLLFLLLNNSIPAIIKSSYSGFSRGCAVMVTVVTAAASIATVSFSTTSTMKQQITGSASLPRPDAAACSPPLQSSCRSP